MARGDRIPSDHSTIETIRARIVRHTGSRNRLELPATDALPAPGTVVRMVLDEGTRFARVESGRTDSERWITAIHSTAAAAGDPSRADSHLGAWVRANDLGRNRSVLVDVLVHEYAYGLRAPGDRRVYPVIDPPDTGLADIARSLDR